MTDLQNINIESLIVHILDNETQIPVFSDKKHPLNDEIKEFVLKHISKVINDSSLKTGTFDINSKIKARCEKIDNETFIENSVNISKILYNLMIEYPSIPSCDLVLVLFSINSTKYLGILKFNYKTSYIHYVVSEEDGNVNKIIRQRTTLPNENQKVDECAIIDLSEFNIKIIEKKYDLNGENDYYFSSKFIGSISDISDKEKIKNINKATYDFNKKYFDNDLIASSNLNNSIKECIEEKEEIDIEVIAEKTFSNNSELKGLYKEHVKEYGINNNVVLNNSEFGEKVYSKQKIKTDDGIEIKLPREYFNDTDKLEFINNANGTVSIVIKNIRGIDKV